MSIDPEMRRGQNPRGAPHFRGNHAARGNFRRNHNHNQHHQNAMTSFNAPAGNNPFHFDINAVPPYEPNYQAGPSNVRGNFQRNHIQNRVNPFNDNNPPVRNNPFYGDVNAAYGRESDYGGNYPQPGPSNAKFNGNRNEIQQNFSRQNRGNYVNNQNRRYSSNPNLESSNYGSQHNLSGSNGRGRTHNANENNGEESNQKRRGPYKFRFGFKKFEEISKMDPEMILMEMMKNQDALMTYLETELTDDTIVLLLHVFSNMCLSKMAKNLPPILVLIIKGKYIKHLEEFVLKLPLKTSDRNRNRYFWNDINGFFLNLSFLCEKIADLIPNSAEDFLIGVIKAVVYTIPNFEKESGYSLSEDSKLAFEILQIKLITITEKKEERKQRAAVHNYDFEDEELPPNNFRDVSIYPTSEEITTEGMGFLRHNKIKGNYSSVEHYLDVQFRLLREDFVSPLREGVCDFLDPKSDENYRPSSIKVYKDIRVVGPQISQNQLGFLIQVMKPQIKKNRHQNLEHSKRFMFGSLVCFTCDKFKTITFGRVIDRKAEFLERGQIVVGFDAGVKLSENEIYLMAESKVYFEPYYHVLKALQSFHVQDFPLEDYFINIDDVKDNVEPPDYLLGKLYKIKNRNIDILHGVWPHHEEMDLNISQMEAYKTGLTKKFSVIQGPPGTGKTYLGLKVAHTLLENRAAWKAHGPMLVVCFTNHALDQFLEGILPVTNEIIRVGGQSRNEALNDFNIKDLRLKYRRRTNNQLLRQKLQNVMHMSRELSIINQKLIRINSYSGVINFAQFRQAVPGYEVTWFKDAKDTDILQWLMEDFYRNFNINDQLQPTLVPDLEEDEEEEIDEMEKYMEDIKQKSSVDIDEDFLAQHIKDDSFISLEQLRNNMAVARLNIEKQDPRTQAYFDAMYNYQLNKGMHEYIANMLQMLSVNNNKSMPLNVDLNNPFRMSIIDRWLLYDHWLDLCRPFLIERIRHFDEQYRESSEEYNEVKDIIDIEIMREKCVIGMTTTGAARLQAALQILKCPIVIVEEAAEVLESHIVTSLSSRCQHLILIGDHKQLRPATADWNVDNKYLLGISLFERMIENKFPCSVLEVQHRMRPEIARLITPSIYEKLENHYTVYDKPMPPGVVKPLYFITHNNQENTTNDTSKENIHEAKYLLELARYFVLNKVEPNKITILAGYAGQLFLLLRERKKFSRLAEVKIAVLDNYQGEENDIILLSLVRNNNKDQIGFLKLENRICVALSRAKNGMYVMGNMDLLCANPKTNKTWLKIKDALKESDALGPALALRCEKHQDQITQIETIEDFRKVPEGGCMKMCEETLNCGHTCNKLCHALSHEEMKCMQRCLKTLCEYDHQCPKQCYEKCDKCLVPKNCTLKCGHTLDIPCHMDPDDVLCPIDVETKLPCDHIQHKPCYEDPNVTNCQHKCDARIEPCGHSCVKLCHIRQDPDHLEYHCKKPCERQNIECMLPEDPTHKCKKLCYMACEPCRILVPKHRTVCPHVFKVLCSQDVDEIVCKKPCKKMLDCGHTCKKECNEPCGGCKIKVEKIIKDCGHKVKVECYIEPTRALCKGNCVQTLPCGHKCKLKCLEKCDQSKCTELVASQTLTSPCRHKVQVPCNMQHVAQINDEILSYCKEKCTKKLECEHMCSGKCGECFQGRMHKSCSEKCSKILVCGHSCTINCSSMCGPCQMDCSYRCVHSKCMLKCGAPCTDCMEECQRRCRHQSCTKRCHEICDVPPCTQPCPKKLQKCGHDCIGFCGDPCPPVCRICDEEEVMDIFFGNENEPNARFVYLEECKHFFESSGLGQWFEMSLNGESVTTMHCPKCKSNVILTQRYSEYIKKAYKIVVKVKKQHYGQPEKIEEARKALLARSETLLDQIPRSLGAAAKGICTTFIQNLQPVKNKRRNETNTHFLSVYSSKFEIFEQICHAYIKQKFTKKVAAELALNCLGNLFNWLNRQSAYITNQEIEDYKLELNRLRRVLQLCKIVDNSANFSTHQEYTQCYRMLFSFLPYNDDNDDRVIKRSLEVLAEKTKSGLNITDEERKEILKAMQLNKGHWYKCPNGHVYCIGDCGGAMELSKCPECKVTIGGTSHRLTAGNAVATEMDGARHSAFSDAMNIANFDPREFM